MYDLSACLSNANDFFEISSIIDCKRTEFEYKYLSVYGTNLSFSCELYLKYLLLKNSCSLEKIQKRGHNLKKLFNLLQKNFSSVAEIILEYYDQECPRNDIENLLASDGANFMDFRYLYEKRKDGKDKQIHSSDLAIFARALKKVCNNYDDIIKKGKNEDEY